MKASPGDIARGFKKKKQQQQAAATEQPLPGGPAGLLVRPLSVVELTANLKRANDDCVFAADPQHELGHARVGPDVPAFVHVTVSLGRPLQKLPACATINEVSRLFEFTEDQHRAFTIVARALLESLVFEDVDADDMVDSEVAVARYQQLLLLHGMGGTGKSYIIQGLLAVATSWGRPNSVGTFATTGVAAINVLGETIASLLFYYNMTGSITSDLRVKLGALRVLIVDEMSMIQHDDLNKLCKLLRKVKQRNLPFGGLTVMLAGDFAQLPPVGGPCVFTFAKNEGFDLYRSVCRNATVVLNQVILTF